MTVTDTDQATTDQATTDQATTDQASTDQASTDQATTDAATTDAATSDQATTDQATTDAATSETAIEQPYSGHTAGDADRGRDADRASEIPAAGWRDIAVRVKNEFKKDHVTLTSSGVAFFGFLALVPLIAAGVSIYGLIADPSQVTRLVDRIDGSIPREVSAFLEQQLTTVAGSSAGALGFGVAIGILVSLWSASSAFSHLMEAVNIAYDEDTDDRPFWKKRLLAIGFTLGLLALLAGAAAVLTVASKLADSTGVAVVWQLLGWAAVAALMGLSLAVLYRFGPDRADPQWRWVSWGATFAVVGWIAVSLGFRYYVSNFGSYNETYGSLATIVVLLMWLYLSAMVVTLGAEINSEIEHQTAEDTTVGPEEPIGRRDAVMADTVGEPA